MLLLYVTRQQDMKPVAKGLIERFRSFKGVLDASAADLQAIDGVGEGAATLIRFVKEAAVRYLQQTSRASFALDQPRALIDDCIMSLGSAPNGRIGPTMTDIAR